MKNLCCVQMRRLMKKTNNSCVVESAADDVGVT